MRRKLFYVFLILLAASYAWRWRMVPSTGPANPAQKLVVVPEIKDGKESGREVQLAYREFKPANKASAPVVILVHGSPGSSNQVASLAKLLGKEFRTIIPDLPGFGASTRRIPDYSNEAHARYLVALMDTLEIDRAHLVGFSMGGGVILRTTDLSPRRVESLTLLSSIGVQELELLGDYLLNHGVHGAQLVGLWALQNLTPHFGYMDDAMLNVAYARNFFDTDQRPLRGILEDIEIPLLIIHGKKDPLVPYAAAVEHHRIVPQSELVAKERNHFFVFRHPEVAARPIRSFVERVERGQAATRSTAAPDRIMLADKPFDWSAQGKAVSTSTFMVLLALGTLVTEDLTCISTGILASKGVIPFWAGVLACTVGIIFGDGLLYVAGRSLGLDALKKRPFRWVLTEARVEQSAHFFHQYGLSLIFITRFIPGTRLPTYFAAGLLGTSAWKFALYFTIASVVWTPLLVGVSYFIGGRMLNWFQQYEGYSLIGLAAVFLVLWLVVRVIFPLFSWRGRRMLLGKWRRLTRWEFWPAWIIYPPVIVYILWLGIRHRSLTLFTASNPGIPGSGVALESKSAILSAFQDSPEIAAFELIPGELVVPRKIEVLEAFMEAHKLSFPVVLKPDVGERGQGVAIIDQHEAAETYLRLCPFDVIAQEYIPGEEFGIFYYRHPGSERGHIFSITDKRLLSVTGDGEKTLEELIIRDNRAVCMSPYFLDKLATHLDEIPARGEAFPLTRLGTHCRGAVFLDGKALLSPELTQAIDTLSRHFDGFYFGRYDVRVPTREDLRKGSRFKVLELNGVTSEATHIYQPGTPLFRAWLTLMRQWRIAFEIGAANVRNGHSPLSLADLFRLVQRFRNQEKFEA